MAIQQVNTYTFTIYLKSKKNVGDHTGLKVMAVGSTAAAAQSVLQQQFGNDLQTITGGILVTGSGPAYTTLA